MKKLAKSGIAALVIWTLSALPAFAAKHFGELAEKSPIKSTSDLADLIVRIVRWLQLGFFLAATVMVILAAFDFLFSKGDAQKVKQARTTLIYAAAAIIIALIAGGFILIIRDIVSAK